ncbi:unnamed protein product, partial [Discosporangium mesarthrocarpum]
MAQEYPDIPQQEIISFLKNPANYPVGVETVDVHETHGAMIFLAGDFAYKIKKAVKFPYMDFSTLAKRQHFCERELSINQPGAPEIYVGLTAITKEADGSLAFSGSGQTVEWAVKMKRFEQEMMLDRLPHGRVTEKALIKNLATSVLDYHQKAPIEKT